MRVRGMARETVSGGRPGDSLEQLRARLARFAAERDWEQFHSPKNLSMALIAECAELVEHFQWMSEEESLTLTPQRREAVRLELADILNFLVRCADRLGVDLVEAANDKIAINETRYPVDRVRGSARRASEYEQLRGSAPQKESGGNFPHPEGGSRRKQD